VTEKRDPSQTLGAYALRALALGQQRERPFADAQGDKKRELRVTKKGRSRPRGRGSS